MQDFSVTDLFALKSMLEAQIEADFMEGLDAKSDGAFDFLIGQWDLVRTSFGADGKAVSETTGTVDTTFILGGRAIQEEFYNHRAGGTAYRAGIALYTYSPSSEQWHVAAIDASTGATSYQPVWKDGEVRYESVVSLPDREIYTKSRLFNISDEGTEWEQQVSIDRITWHPNYHIAQCRRI